MIKYLDLARINSRFRADIDRRIAQVLNSGQYLQGVENDNFCLNFARYCGVKYVLGVGNGLDALRIMLRAAGLGPGDEVIVPANTFIATILAITQCGCTPVPVEPNLTTYNIDPVYIERAITGRTKAIMAVHLYGQIAPMREIQELAQRYGLLVFEDSAQAHGAIYGGKRAGNLSHAGAFSFYPGKNLGALGDGGAITTNDENLYNRAHAMANYGALKKYEHYFKGCNSRLDELQAAVLDVKLKTLDRDNEKRRHIAHYYINNIKNELIINPQSYNEDAHVWHIYPVRVKKRALFQSHMQSCGIETLIHYPTPPHKQNAYKEWMQLSFPITEKIHNEVVSLPLHQELEKWEMDKIVEAANAFN
ncbi:DegT/DnrJ/EryC1/StrS aminotransferase family protein [uncultured Desulfovibrio sp.]|uniref:DegT/DnrJ/EryC1/StrS family aminotransferase n=1 Tax=uncultured Desulfovibrio sp. TaxID=167968 RepID=UPI00271215AA|nr:DegT/DnrJ/EryC1/StrS family aminotransferase [uncultured Desulfovibrio sp.]